MRIENCQAFTLLGIAVRTSNQAEAAGHGKIDAEAAGHGKIAACWGRFISEDLAHRIPGRTGPDIVALYTDYASDETGAYTFILGARVAAGTECPAGMVTRTVAPARYAVFEVAPGPPVETVPAAWSKIWSQPPTDNYRRAFIADFEVYSETGVEIYVGLRP